MTVRKNTNKVEKWKFIFIESIFENKNWKHILSRKLDLLTNVKESEFYIKVNINKCDTNS